MLLKGSKGVQRIGHIALRVENLDRAKSFYLNLGMQLIWDDKDWCYLDAGTLLGAVRQGAFAGRPSDVDVTFPIRDEATHVIHSLVQTPHFANFKTLQERTQIYYQPISNFGGRLGNPVLCDVSHGSECFCPPHDPLDTSNKRAMTADVFCRPFPICPCYEQRLESLYGFEWKIPSSTQVAERESKIRVYGD